MTVSPLPLPSADRLPPQSIEAERAVLGCILYQPDSLGEIADKLPPEAFYLQQHQAIYQACLTLHKRGIPCDMMQVFTHLRDSESLERAGGQVALAGLIEEVVTAANVAEYADLVVQKWHRRRLGLLGSKMQQLQYDTQGWPEIYEQVEAELFALSTSQSKKGLRLLEDVMADCTAEAEERSQQKTLPGMPTGFIQLDRMTTGGFHAGDLILCAARPAMGKTAWALQVSRFIAANSQKPVAVFSLEMSDQQLAYRLWSADAGIESSRLKTGRIGDQSAWESAYSSAASLAELPVAIDDAFSPTISHIRTQCRKLMARKGELGLVFVDYLQLMDGSNDRSGGNRVQELSGLTRSLKMLARELQCPVLALSQLSRGVESRTNKRPMMSDLRDSGALEQDADLVLMLYREEYYEPDTADRGVAECIVTKNRHGPTGTVKLLFQPEYTRFLNLKEAS